MIKIGEVYFDTVLETLFIVDAVSSTRVYLLELKEKIDPRVVVEKPATIWLRYKLTNIGNDIVDNKSNVMQYPLAPEGMYVNSKSIEHLTDVDNNAKPLTGDMMVYSFGPENKNISPYSTNRQAPAPPLRTSYVTDKLPKPSVKAKAKPGRRIVKKVTKKLIKKRK